MTDERIIHHLIDRAQDAAEQTAKAPELWAYLNRLAKKIEELQDMIRAATVDEVKKYGKEGRTVGGLHLVIRHSGTKYDFSGVPVILEMEKKLKEYKNLSKMAAKNGVGIADKDGVEIGPAMELYGTETVFCEQIRS